jgi:hypothetical protein
MKDKLGGTFTEGCTVVRAVLWGKSPMLELCKVTRIDNGKLYLDNSKQAMRYPERLLIFEQDKLFRMIDQYGDVDKLGTE